MAHILQTLLSEHPLLSGHLGRSRRCPLNRGFTVLECGRPICLSTTSMIRERIQRHEVPLPNLYYFKLFKIHSRAREIAHTTSKACEYCPTMEEKEALSFCPEFNNAQESHACHFFRFIIVILLLSFFSQDYGLLRTKMFCYHGNVTQRLLLSMHMGDLEALGTENRIG